MNDGNALRSPGSSNAVAALEGEFLPDLGTKTLPARRTTLGRPLHLLELACRVTHAPWGGLGLVTGDGELAEHLCFGLPEETVAELLRSHWAAGLLRFVLGRPAATVLDDLGRQAPQLGAPPGQARVGSFLGMPINLSGRCRGVLYLCRAPGSPPFTSEEEELLHPVCAWLEQGRLLEEAHFQAQLQLLNRVAQSAAGSLDLQHILTKTLRELDRHLPLHVCAVWLVDEEADPQTNNSARGGAPVLRLAEVSTVLRVRAEALGLEVGQQLPLEQSPFASCVRDGQALYADWDTPAGPASAVCFAVPLHAGNRTVGVLQSLLTKPTGFVRDQIQLLYLVADLLGPAISNCQLFGRLQAAYGKLRVTQNQLIQTEKMRALGELAGGMAHEFNNSLCGVLGFLELLLLNKGLDPTSRSYLESARTCALDATETVRRVQDFARRQQDGLAVQLLDLGELVRQTLELIRHKWEDLGHARGSPIDVHVQTEANCKVAGSPTELREVITNLVFNAVDAMPAGGTLAVRTWAADGSAYLAVQDSGIGIPLAIRHRLFEPFFTTKGERGNGLGLSVVFGIVHRHQGEIKVESQVGHGSTFTVRLPLAPADLAASPAGTATPEAAAPGLRILVIEDDALVRDFLGRGLTSLGHRPRLTAGGQEGLAAFGEERFDLVLTDLSMPGINGEEVAQQVTRRSPTTPVIVLTGWADRLRAEKEMLHGVAGVLGKPITLEALASTLATVCASRG
jgi:signal transduction histidine kinase